MNPRVRLEYFLFCILTFSLCQGKSTEGTKNTLNSFIKTEDSTCCSVRISDVNSRITNPSYPDADSKKTSYNYFIQIQDSMCGLRFTYENILLYKMPSGLGTASPCSMDSITVLAPDYPIQPICGNLNRNQVNVPVQGGQTVQILVVTQSSNHYWNILLNQIPCDNVESKPLEQYHGQCGKRPARHGHSFQPTDPATNANNAPMIHKVKDDVDSSEEEEEVSVCPIGHNHMRCYLDNIMHHMTMGLGQDPNKIINGQQARRNSWPWQIVLLVKGKQLLCGGALVSPNLVVTAGHCLATTQRGLNVSELTVAAGVHRIGTIMNVNAQYRHCDKVVIHAQYSDIHSDIALCFLNKPMNLTQTVSPVCLPYDTDKDYAGQEATITGFGKTSDNSGPATVLHEAPIPIVSNKDCQDAWTEIGGKQFSDLIEHSMICAGGKNKSTCNGDSGGPLTVKSTSDRHVLVGLTSFGPGTLCNVPDKPLSVFTRVTSHLKFIGLAIANTTFEDMSSVKTYTPCID